jgi:hypothetical protein
VLALAALAGAVAGPGVASAAEYTGGWQDVESYEAPKGSRTQLATGNLADGGANLLVYQPSTEDFYANVAEDTGTLSHLMLDADTGLRTVITSTGERRTFAKIITGDFVTDNDPNVILYDRYKP